MSRGPGRAGYTVSIMGCPGTGAGGLYCKYYGMTGAGGLYCKYYGMSGDRGGRVIL